MSSGDEDDHIHRPAKESIQDKYAQHPQLLRYMKEPYNWDATFKVPYIGGISKDGKTVYGDRRFPWMQVIQGKHINFSRIVAVHERFEWWLVHNLGMKYDPAHIWANTAESLAVEAEGITYKQYDYPFPKWLKVTEKGPFDDLPPDLDPYPYFDNKPVLQALRNK